MSKKRPSTKATANPTNKRYKCPRCKKRYMHKAQKTPGGKQRYQCRDPKGTRQHCYSTTDPTLPYVNTQSGKPVAGDKNQTFRRALSGSKRFVITAAQNATPLHEPFFESLKQYAKFNDAELVVIPLRYKNATSRWTQSQANAEVWEVADEYLCNERKNLNENLLLLADIKTQPTASLPLSAFDAIPSGKSAILGHTKLQLKTVATPQSRLPVILTTTGACTVRNYTDTKAGKIGEFHHTLGACVVDVVGKKFFMRQVNAMSDGHFIDLDNEYTPVGVYEAEPALALVMGDTHRAFIDPAVESATFDEGGMVERMNPQYIVFHDLHDGYARNPHHRQNPFNEIAKRGEAMHLVEREVRGDIDWLKERVKGREGVVVSSNHDDFFARYITDTDWRRDPENASFYLETAKAMVDSTHMTDSGTSYIDPFIYWVEKLRGKSPIRCLKRDEAFTLGGVELSMHGDQGPNGVRGSRMNLKRIGVKSIIGHSHSPGIEEGCYQTGTSTPLKLEYNSGPSSWLQCHVILYANGKRSLLPIINGKWSFD